MAASALKQFMSDVIWDELDFLLYDMPPGTGDIQLTLTQTVPLTGAVIVTTPQEISLIDARKGAKMYEKVNVPVLGIIENMSYYSLPSGKNEYIFGQGGGKKLAEELGISFLGEIPLNTVIRKSGDEGKPEVLAHPESVESKQFINTARNLIEIMKSIDNSANNQPVIEL